MCSPSPPPLFAGGEPGFFGRVGCEIDGVADGGWTDAFFIGLGELCLDPFLDSPGGGLSAELTDDSDGLKREKSVSAMPVVPAPAPLVALGAGDRLLRSNA